MRVTGVSIGKISPPRLAAFEALTAVEEGEYASDALRERTRILDTRDAGLAGRIVFGCLRYQAQLDHLIFHYSGRKADRFDTPVRICLRTAMFQLRYLDRIPAHAAVDEAVELIKRHRRAAAGLTNAVLRKVDRMPVAWPDVATELSCPTWLLERWSAHFGADQARGIAQAALKEPVPYIRVGPGSAAPDGVELEATEVEGCFRVLSPVRQGMRLHDVSSQAILPLLNLQPGDKYLDLCAAPGNKTLQAMEVPVALAVAADVSLRRIQEVPPVCPRVVLNATSPLPFSCRFDRIFVDAPCSGTGTLARNPEIKWRVQAEDFGRFGEKQSEMLARALQVLAPGGKLLYATCSLEPEENQQVVRRVTEQHPEMHLEREMWRLPGREEGDGFFAAILGVGYFRT